jgi:hypothetical protein
MHDHGSVQLYAVDCSDYGQPTVTSSLCVRPDLCYPCFGDHLARLGVRG